MRFKATLLLASLFVGLGLYLFFVEFPQEQKKMVEAEKASRVFSFSSKEVIGLTIRYPNTEEISLTKDHDGKWRMKRPMETAANDAVIYKIIGLTDSLEFKRVVEEKPSDLHAFGLDPPQSEVTLKFPDHEERLLIGENAPASSAYYVKKGQEPRVLLVDHQMGDLKHSLEEERSVKAWRRKEIAELTSDRLETIRLDYRNKAITLTKEGKEWRIREPIRALADRLAVNGLVQTISGLTAEDYIDDEKTQEERKFGPSRLILTLKGGSQSQTINFYRPAPLRGKKDEGRFYAVSTPEEPIYVLKGKGLDDLNKTLYDLRDKVVLNIHRLSVQEIRIQNGPESFSLLKKGDDWRMGDQKTETDKAKVEKLLDALELLRAEKFVDDAPKDLSVYGLAKPLRQIALYDKDGKPLSELLLGKDQGDRVYAMSGPQPGNPVVLVKKTILDFIRSKAEFAKKG
jgi:Domain of unknown function (DUF4340)